MNELSAVDETAELPSVRVSVPVSVVVEGASVVDRDTNTREWDWTPWGAVDARLVDDTTALVAGRHRRRTGRAGSAAWWLVKRRWTRTLDRLSGYPVARQVGARASLRTRRTRTRRAPAGPVRTPAWDPTGGRTPARTGNVLVRSCRRVLDVVERRQTAWLCVAAGVVLILLSMTGLALAADRQHEARFVPARVGGHSQPPAVSNESPGHSAESGLGLLGPDNNAGTEQELPVGQCAWEREAATVSPSVSASVSASPSVSSSPSATVSPSPHPSTQSPRSPLPPTNSPAAGC